MAGDFWAFEEFVTSAKMNKQIDANQGNIAESAYKILAAALSFINGDNVAAEDFTSAGGANGTVNIGSTTSLFSTDKYEMPDVPDGIDDVSPVGQVLNATGSTTSVTGYRVQITSDCTVISFTKHVSDQATRALIKSDSNVVLATANFVGNVATFSGVLKLDAGTFYRFVVDANGANHNYRYRNVAAPYPIAGNNFNYISGDRFGTPGNTFPFSIESVTTQNVSKATESEVLCDSNTLDIDSETDSFCLHWQGSIPGTSVAKFELSDGINTTDYPVNQITKKTGVINKDLLSNTSNVKIKALMTDLAGNGIFINGWGISKL